MVIIMTTDKFGELVARIDERTANMERRQLEEISKREKLVERVDALENWRNYILGAHAAGIAALSILGISVKAKHQ